VLAALPEPTRYYRGDGDVLPPDQRQDLPRFLRGLVEAARRDRRNSWALTLSRNFPRSAVEGVECAGDPKSAFSRCLRRKITFSVRELLGVAYQQEPNEKPRCFGSSANRRRQCGAGTDRAPARQGRIARVHIINILSASTSEVQTAVVAQLKDPHKLIRGASLMPCARWTKSSMCSACARCCVIRDRRPEQGVMWSSRPTIRIPSATDRCAEGRKRVRTPLGSGGSQRDRQCRQRQIPGAGAEGSDWWVQSRAADALGKIGGPKVIDAVLRWCRTRMTASGVRPSRS